MLEKRFCPYCGTPVTVGCDCAQELAEYEELEERQLAYAWQQDLIDLHRFER